MALLSLTQTSSGSSFSLDEKNVLKIYASDSKNLIEYLDVVKGIKKTVEVDEASADTFALASNMVETTANGTTIYLSVDRISKVYEINSLAVVRYDEGTETPSTINLDVDQSTFEAGIPSGGSSYKVYTALLAQSGTLDPTATVLENTMTGGVTLTRRLLGKYRVTCSDIVAGKTFIAGATDWWGNGNTIITLSDESAIIGYLSIYTGNTGYLDFVVLSPAWAYTDWSTIMGDSKLNLEFKVYP